MVYSLPLFPCQAQLSPIKTDYPACLSTIYGQTLEGACKHYGNFLFLTLFKGAPYSRIDLPIRQNAYFLGSCPGCVEVCDAWGVHHFISETTFLGFTISFG